MDIFKRKVFVTFKTKPSFYGVLNLQSQVVFNDNGDRAWIENLLAEPDLASIQFRD